MMRYDFILTIDILKNDTIVKQYFGLIMILFCMSGMLFLLGTLACVKIAKSLKSQAPQGFSGCLDIDNDEMSKQPENPCGS